jgi:acyl-[acyl-carrier-protein] desaturase
MPAMNLRQSYESIGASFNAFSDAAQRLGVYTAQDYIQILSTLLAHWRVDHLRLSTDAAEKARDYLMALPGRLQKITDRMPHKSTPVQFKWVLPPK